MIVITINGQPQTFAESLTVEQVLHALKVTREDGIAVALNHSVIHKSDFQKTQLQHGDHLEIIHATAGG